MVAIRPERGRGEGVLMFLFDQSSEFYLSWYQKLIRITRVWSSGVKMGAKGSLNSRT